MFASLRNRDYKQAVLRRLDGSDPTALLPAGGQTERRFVEAFFVVMGRLAKLDGRVLRSEIDFANQLMQRLELTPAAREHAIACFNLGKDQNLDVMLSMQAMVKRIGPGSALAYEFLRVLCQFTQVKGVINLPEKMLLRDVAESLGYDKSDLLELCAAQVQQPPPRAGQLSRVMRDAYATLQLECDALDSEIRKAYLRLMSRYHPDKIRRSNLTPETLRQAQEQSTAVRAAYETICGFRKIRA